MATSNDTSLFLIPHNHIDGDSSSSLDNGILVCDGQTKGRLELVKSVIRSCKRRRNEMGMEGKCSTCEFICREGSKYLSRKMMTFRSRLKDTIMIEVKEKMTSWMKHNDRNLCTKNCHDGTICITLNVNDTIHFRLPGGVAKNSSWISFTIQEIPSFETEKDETNNSTSLQKVNHNEKSVSPSSSSSSSTSLLEMPPMANPYQLDLSMSLNLTMGTSTESQTSGANPYKPKRLLSKLSITDLDSIRKRWENDTKCDEDYFIKKKKEFKCFIIDFIKQNRSDDGDYDDNCYSIFRKTVA